MSWEPRLLQGGVKKKTEAELHTMITRAQQYSSTRMRAKRELVKRTGVANKDALKMNERQMDEIIYGREIGIGRTPGRAGMQYYRRRERGNGAPFYSGDESR